MHATAPGAIDLSVTGRLWAANPSPARPSHVAYRAGRALSRLGHLPTTKPRPPPFWAGRSPLGALSRVFYLSELVHSHSTELAQDR